MENPRTQLFEQIQQANNVLITVSRNPSLDQLSAAIGLTLLLNKLGKHATAVFSGEVPSILEYLKPNETFEKNTDSLRDFIISLDKAKADKLRYKVEEKVVKIFITPYRSSLSQEDLIFSQGDFNVDLVVALGVKEQKDIDQAIVSHGRILHDATVSSVNNSGNTHLGTIGWTDAAASSLCEMVYGLAAELKKEAIDSQTATAFLTGIISETKRFSNEKTSAQTMEVSSHLLEAGANQQLVAAKLEVLPVEEAPQPPPKPVAQPPKPKPQATLPNEGTLVIPHQPLQAELTERPKQDSKVKDAGNDQESVLHEIDIDEKGYLRRDSQSDRQAPFNSSLPQKSGDQSQSGLVAANEGKPSGNQAPAILPEPAKTEKATLNQDQTLQQLENDINDSVSAPKQDAVDSQNDTKPDDLPGLAEGADSGGDTKPGDGTKLSDDTKPGNDSSPIDDTRPAGDTKPESTDDSKPPAPEAEFAAETIAPTNNQTANEPPETDALKDLTQDLEAARNAVEEAVASGDTSPLPPRMDLNASTGLEVPHDDVAQLISPTQSGPAPETVPAEPAQALEMPELPQLPEVAPPAEAPLPPPTPPTPPPPAPAQSAIKKRRFLHPSSKNDDNQQGSVDPTMAPPLPPPIMPSEFTTSQTPR